jgi:uncharacterized protein
MPAFEPSPLTKISRSPHRGSYDKETIYGILDEALDVTVSYIADGLPHAIPTGFVRLEDKLYIHGSAKSHFLGQLCRNEKVCLTVSLLDGLVLANTAFSHSFNYRSVVAFAKPFLVEDEALKWAVLQAFTDKILPGRWEDGIRLPTPEELKATAMVCFPLGEASAKMRQGAPNNEKSYPGEVWTGHIPLRRTWQAPVPSPDQGVDRPLPGYIKNLGQVPHP